MVNSNTSETKEEFLKNAINCWVSTLQEIISKAESEQKKVVLVAMSRKMYRLLQYFEKKRYCNFTEHCTVVTEHALPYILPSLRKEKCKLIVIDDAMYYGATLAEVTAHIYRETGEKPEVCPIVTGTHVRDLPYAHTEKTAIQNSILKDEWRPFLTTQYAQYLLQLQSPVDLEFPILRIPIQGVQVKENEEMMTVLTDVFTKRKCKSYAIKHEMIDENGKMCNVYNYTVLPEFGSDLDQFRSDFSKLRIYIQNDEIQIVSFCLGMYDERILNKNHVLFDDIDIQGLWEQSLGKIEDFGSRYIENKQTEEELKALDTHMFANRSKVVWANYLSSFLYLLINKEAICELITRLGNVEKLSDSRFDKNDIVLLIGEELGDGVVNRLTKIFQSDTSWSYSCHSTYSMALAAEKQLPVEYIQHYGEENPRRWLGCKNIKEALSYTFGCLYRMLNNTMKESLRRRSEFLRIGLSYASMEEDLAYAMGSENLWQSIHQWIDRAIDEGVVKPKYERVLFDNAFYWKRLFRSGENEDSFLKMLRICIFIVQRIQEKQKTIYVDKEMVENLMSIIWEDRFAMIHHDYRWGQFKTEYGQRFRPLVYLDDDQKHNSFLSYAEQIGYISTISNQKGLRLMTIAPEILTELPASETTSFSSSQEEALRAYIDMYYYYYVDCGKVTIINNFLPCDDESANLKLQKWETEVANYIYENQDTLREGIFPEEMKEKFADLQNSFVRLLFATLRSPGLERKETMTQNEQNVYQLLIKTLEETNYNDYVEQLSKDNDLLQLFDNLYVKKEKIAESFINYLSSRLDDSFITKIHSVNAGSYDDSEDLLKILAKQFKRG